MQAGIVSRDNRTHTAMTNNDGWGQHPESKSRGGRPRLPQNRVRRVRIKVSLSDDEALELMKGHDGPMAAIVRNAALAHARAQTPEEQPEQD